MGKMDTKSELMEAALKLFEEQGYENTPIKEIHTKVGVSKGAFYHYFDSKEDILEEIALDYSNEIIWGCKKIANNKDLAAYKKLEEIIILICRFKLTPQEKRDQLSSVIINLRNTKLRESIFYNLKEEVIAPLKMVLSQGVEEGTMDVPDKYQMSEIIFFNIRALYYSLRELFSCLNKDNELEKEEFGDELKRKIAIYEEIFARILNLKNNKIELQELMRL